MLRSEELVVQDEKDQEDEADNYAYGNQFLLFGPVAKNGSVNKTERVSLDTRQSAEF